jgi:hypothetical protein
VVVKIEARIGGRHVVDEDAAEAAFLTQLETPPL